jgi:hypothetical protein
MRPKTKPSRSGTPTMHNAERGRPMVMLTLSPEGLAELDAQRGAQSRGVYVELLLRVVRNVPLRMPDLDEPLPVEPPHLGKGKAAAKPTKEVKEGLHAKRSRDRDQAPKEGPREPRIRVSHR